LIKIRKEHPAFRITNAGQIASLIRFDENTPAGVIVYEIDGKAVNDKWEKIRVMFNGTSKNQTLQFDAKNWQAAILNNKIPGVENFQGSNSIEPFTCSIYFKKR